MNSIATKAMNTGTTGLFDIKKQFWRVILGFWTPFERARPLLSKAPKCFDPGACFAAGTLVHTKEGLVPIEQIKVGDYVLSKSENGGEQAYKRGLKAIQRPAERVIHFDYFPDPTKNRVTTITCTINHPIWVKNLGWTAAEDLHRSSKENMLELADGRNVKAHGTTNIYISDQLSIGWFSNSDNDVEAYGALWDFVNSRLVDPKVESLQVIQDHQVPYNDSQFGTFPEELCLHLPVYNLEVEDFHTYYVGQHGVWVHNTNCGGVNFEARRAPSNGRSRGQARINSVYSNASDLITARLL